MPFKSKAQVRKFYMLVKQGKMSKKELEKWENETPSIKGLPERVKGSNKSYINWRKKSMRGKR
jgi:hypothetical protein